MAYRLTSHRVRRYCDERGHVAVCTCGWRIIQATGQAVADAAARHEREES